MKMFFGGSKMTFILSVCRFKLNLFTLGLVYCRLRNYLQQFNVNASLHDTLPRDATQSAKRD